MKTHNVTKAINKCYVIKLPNGKWGYVGKIPFEIYYVDGATEEQIRLAKKFGEAFGPRRRTFGTKQEAVDFANDHGVKLGEIIK